MTDHINKIWNAFTKQCLDSNSNALLRKGSSYKKAENWLNKTSGPALPTKMLSNVCIYNSWINPHNISLAREIIKYNDGITFQELVYEMLMLVNEEKTPTPYIWWLWPHSSKSRAVHEDANGQTFIKIENKWHLVYSAQVVGVLVGTQGTKDYEQIPSNCYFVSWESEEISKNYF